jgi:hypothetical protein
MDNLEVVQRTDELVDEEHHLRRAHAGTAPGTDELRRLRQVEVALDQCWDLPRQRPARRLAGRDPTDAVLRPEETVER